MRWEAEARCGRVATVRLQINPDRLENFLNAFTSRSGNKRLPSLEWLSLASFLPEQTPMTDTVTMKAVLRSAISFSLLIPFYFAASIFAIVTIIAAAFLSVHLHHHVHQLHWRLIKLLYGFGLHRFFQHDPPLDYVYCIAAMSGLGFGFFSALRWAWNRRAGRLKRELVLPEPVSAEMPGVWPPPPVVSVNDALKK